MNSLHDRLTPTLTIHHIGDRFFARSHPKQRANLDCRLDRHDILLAERIFPAVAGTDAFLSPNLALFHDRLQFPKKMNIAVPMNEIRLFRIGRHAVMNHSSLEGFNHGAEGGKNVIVNQG